ncbi:helix-turn-helix domain-containing protein [uncultured Dokdonia sp.]|uniref:helix-turn-helix domain-containing protein n=1 Tax=uncultured Dokdonia sp. TaxID=575653 RepID=UPI0026389004|nr:helix-turn-helix domain-containing protein [uncultured Dokdonia sp.]
MNIYIRACFLQVYLGMFLMPFMYGQTISDSLYQKTYEELRKGFLTHYFQKDTIQATLYASVYLNKARKDKEPTYLVNGYYYNTLLETNDNNKIALLDTIIDISIDFTNKNFPTTGYYDKGAYYYKQGQFELALDNFLKASAYNKGTNKEYLGFLLNQAIGILKTEIDQNEEALVLIKDCWKYVVDNNFKEKNPEMYFDVLHSLANSYRKTNFLDSARVYTRLGLIDENTTRGGTNYNRFLLLSGILESYSSNYKEAESQLSEAISNFNSKTNKRLLSTGYYFLGKTNLESGKEDKAIAYYKKVDSLFEINNDILPENMSGYQHIIKYYKNKNNIEEELKYTQKLITVDSFLDKNYRILNKGIIKKYEIPKLVEGRDILINQLKNDQKKSKLYIVIGFGGIFLILGVAIFQYKKRHLYKKRFLDIINKEDDKVKEKSHKNQIRGIPAETPIEIPQDTIDDILKKLQRFERNEEYINGKLTLHNLADNFGTNNSYLSKVINHYKKTSFSTYIKQLRVAYAFNKLKSDATFRKYTIKAIGQTCGFKTAESFSKTFFKIYGIYPSYFIKQIEKINT